MITVMYFKVENGTDEYYFFENLRIASNMDEHNPIVIDCDVDGDKNDITYRFVYNNNITERNAYKDMDYSLYVILTKILAEKMVYSFDSMYKYLNFLDNRRHLVRISKPEYKNKVFDTTLKIVNFKNIKIEKRNLYIETIEKIVNKLYDICLESEKLFDIVKIIE